MTGQPDFTHIVIDDVPDARLVEPTSLKRNLGSFRNHDAFHQDCTIAIDAALAQTAPSSRAMGSYRRLHR